MDKRQIKDGIVMTYSTEMTEILNKIFIPSADGIRGNITLPVQIDGAKVIWSSDKPAVITDCMVEKMPAGVVKRQSEDVIVTLTATVTLGGEEAKKVLEVCVLKAPVAIAEEDYQGYLFGHFIGEGAEDQEQIYFAVSEDGLHYTDMNGGKPILVSNIGEKGVRDPFLYRSHEGDRFFLVATDLSIFHRGGWFQNEQGYYDASTTGSPYLVIWESLDLVHWGEPKLAKVAPENAGMAWAPEMIYNEETGEYIIFFASSIMNPETKYKAKPNAIYYVATRDFVNFSETKLFIDNQTDGEPQGRAREIIDTTVMKVGDWYYSASKDGDNFEENGGIRVMKNQNLLDPTGWVKVLDLDELDMDLSEYGNRTLDNGLLEGPELFRFNKKDWADSQMPEYGMIADQYAIGAGYVPMKIIDFEDKDNSRKSWKLLSPSEYSFDKLKKRHGTVMNITKDELNRLKKHFS